MFFGDFWSSAISVLELGDRVEIYLVRSYLGVWITAACTVPIPKKDLSNWVSNPELPFDSPLYWYESQGGKRISL